MLTRKKIKALLAPVELEADYQRALAGKEDAGTLEEAWSDGYATAFEELSAIAYLLQAGELVVFAHEVAEDA